MSVGCYDNFATGFTAPDCRAPVLILLNPEFEIFPFEIVRAIIVLLWFFSHAFTYVDYPIAVLDLSIYHSSE